MVDFLSPEWFTAMSADSRAPSSADVDLAIQQVVTGGPMGDVEYSVFVSGDGIAVVRGHGVDAHVRLEQDYATAKAIHDGHLAVDEALASGRIRVTGDTSRLVAAGPALAGASPAIAALRKALGGA